MNDIWNKLESANYLKDSFVSSNCLDLSKEDFLKALKACYDKGQSGSMETKDDCIISIIMDLFVNNCKSLSVKFFVPTLQKLKSYSSGRKLFHLFLGHGQVGMDMDSKLGIHFNNGKKFIDFGVENSEMLSTPISEK